MIACTYNMYTYIVKVVVNDTFVAKFEQLEVDLRYDRFTLVFTGGSLGIT